MDLCVADWRLSLYSQDCEKDSELPSNGWTEVKLSGSCLRHIVLLITSLVTVFRKKIAFWIHPQRRQQLVDLMTCRFSCYWEVTRWHTAVSYFFAHLFISLRFINFSYNIIFLQLFFFIFLHVYRAQLPDYSVYFNFIIIN